MPTLERMNEKNKGALVLVTDCRVLEGNDQFLSDVICVTSCSRLSNKERKIYFFLCGLLPCVGYTLSTSREVGVICCKQTTLVLRLCICE